MLSTMISKMPDVAHEAMNQLYTSVRRNRRQYFYLNKAREILFLILLTDSTIFVTNIVHLFTFPAFQRCFQLKK